MSETRPNDPDLSVFLPKRCKYLAFCAPYSFERPCYHLKSGGRYCALKTCPVLAADEKGMIEASRSKTIATPPVPGMKGVYFPLEYPHGRIELKRGARLIDWRGNAWELFEKEGPRWERALFTDDDYEALYLALACG